MLTTPYTTLEERLPSKLSGPLIAQTDQIISCSNYWQVPAETEKAAFESITRSDCSDGFCYVAIPWATIIDGLATKSDVALKILLSMQKINRQTATDKPIRRVTVAQHIHTAKFTSLFKALGITDVFWSHKLNGVSKIGGINVHAFPLFPAQTPGLSPPTSIRSDRKFLANFIGAYNPNVYLTNVRDCIFSDVDRDPDIRIIKRQSWHFDRAVYSEQMGGISAEHAVLQEEERNKREYLDAIRNSWFTLCPSGSGPNSIRIYESLALGSIPIIITKDLALPGDLALWRQACIIEEDSVNGYRRAVETARATSPAQRIRMLESARILYDAVRPKSYANIICDELQN